LYENEEEKPAEYYVADIERFLLRIDHTLFRNDLGIIGNAAVTPGYLEKKESSWYEKTFYGAKSQDKIPKCSAEELGTKLPDFCVDHLGDHLRLGYLFDLKGINLDEPNQQMKDYGYKDILPFRETGIEVVVNIEYKNTVPFNLFRRLFKSPQADLEYTYEIDKLPSAIYQIERTRPQGEGMPPNQRLRKRQRGLHVIVNARAHIGAFDPPTFCIWLVQITTFLALADKIIGMLITNETVFRLFRLNSETAVLNKYYQFEHTEVRDEAEDEDLQTVLRTRQKQAEHEVILESHGVRVTPRDHAGDPLIDEDEEESE
jgi:hypothetical protein